MITDGPGNYADVMQCKWILSAPAGNYISLYVDSFNTECGYEFYFYFSFIMLMMISRWDFLWIYDGLNETTVPILATFSGLQTSIDPIVSSSNQVSVFFNADAAMNASGFSIRYAFSPCPFNCSDIGVCQMPSRTCSCPVGYDGVGCEKKNCITTGCVNGVCDALSGKCACNATFHGSDCSLGLLQPAWLPMAVNPSSPPRQMLASGGLYIPQIDSVRTILLIFGCFWPVLFWVWPLFLMFFSCFMPLFAMFLPIFTHFCPKFPLFCLFFPFFSLFSLHLLTFFRSFPLAVSSTAAPQSPLLFTASPTTRGTLFPRPLSPHHPAMVRANYPANCNLQTDTLIHSKVTHLSILTVIMCSCLAAAAVTCAPMSSGNTQSAQTHSSISTNQEPSRPPYGAMWPYSTLPGVS